MPSAQRARGETRVRSSCIKSLEEALRSASMEAWGIYLRGIPSPALSCGMPCYPADHAGQRDTRRGQVCKALSREQADRRWPHAHGRGEPAGRGGSQRRHRRGAHGWVTQGTRGVAMAEHVPSAARAPSSLLHDCPRRRGYSCALARALGESTTTNSSTRLKRLR